MDAADGKLFPIPPSVISLGGGKRKKKNTRGLNYQEIRMEQRWWRFKWWSFNHPETFHPQHIAAFLVGETNFRMRAELKRSSWTA